LSFGLLLFAFVAAVNPCRTRLALTGSRAALALGSLIALAAGAALAAAGGVLLDALDVSPESFRLAAGLVLTLEGLRALVLPRPAAEPELPGLGAALVPVAFPILLQPGVVVLALAAGGDDVAGEAIGALALALVLVALAGARPIGARGEALFAAGARLLGALEIAVGAALAVDAIRDV
jgi:small neutral amino acid transporter SnatA (MarC family)